MRMLTVVITYGTLSFTQNYIHCDWSMKVSFTLVLLISVFILGCSKKPNSQSQIQDSALYQPPAIQSSTISFPSRDGILITGTLAIANDHAPFLILCHQAKASRGEYKQILPKLTSMGYNCLAIDQRSGEMMDSIKNGTAQKAIDAKKPTGYMDAEQDILAAIDYLEPRFHIKPILVGSSYSASLALKIAKENNNVSAVAAFSPGEYLEGYTVANNIGGLDKPVFAASTKEEAASVSALLAQVPQQTKTIFTPSGEGVHGARALWPSSPNSSEYWQAFSNWLKAVTK